MLLFSRDTTYLDPPEADPDFCDRCEDQHPPAEGGCDFPGCVELGTECHAGEIYLCAAHYAQAVEAVRSGYVDVADWLSDQDEPERCSCRCHWTDEDYADEAAERAFDAERGN